MRPRQSDRHFPDNMFKCILFYKNTWILIQISLKFKGTNNNIPALVQKMDWRRPGDRPLPDPIMVSLLTHICVTRPKWIKRISWSSLIRSEDNNSPIVSMWNGLPQHLASARFFQLMCLKTFIYSICLIINLIHVNHMNEAARLRALCTVD